MSVNLPNVFTQQFTNLVELLLQEKGGKFRPYVKSGTHVGKQASPVNQVGAIAATEVVSRFEPKTRTDASLTRRWVFPRSFETNQLIDTFDLLRTIVDPKASYGENAALAFGRQTDDLIINAAHGTSYIGETGTSTEAFDTTATTSGGMKVANDFGASAAIGLTVEKMVEMKRAFRAHFVDLEMEQPCLAIGSTQEANLLNQTKVVSTEYNDRPVLVDGKIVRFMGFHLIMSERLLGGGSGSDRQLIAFVQSGMYLGVWQDMESITDRRTDLQGNPWQLTTMGTWGATRLQQGKVGQILARE
ncbi:MAG TPA: phage capsid protein [bacterium]|nr:phage capsid protein [bacterium]